jgi:hypothetical protein
MLPDIINPSYLPSAIAPANEDSFILTYRPLSNPVGASKFDLRTTPIDSACIDLSRTLLTAKFKILLVDGTDLKPEVGVHVGCVNDALASLFPQLTVLLNDQQVSQCSYNNLASYLTNRLENSVDYRRSVLNPILWQEVTGNTQGSDTTTEFTNVAEKIALSKEVTVAGKINSPLFHQKKLLPPGVSLGLGLVLSPVDLFLITNKPEPMKIHITDISLKVRYVRPPQNLLQELQESMLTTPFLLGYNRSDIRVFNIPATFTTFNEQNIFFGKIPQRIIAFFTPSVNLTGSLTTSPFKWTHSKLTDYSFNFNGASIPTNKIPFDLDNKKAEELYLYTLGQLGITESGVTPSYSYDDFINDTFLLCQNFNTDVSINAATKPGSSGFIGIDLKFKVALAASLSLVLVSYYPNSVLSINPDKSVTNEF